MGVRIGQEILGIPPLPPNFNRPNVNLPTILPVAIYKAYKRQIDSQFFVTQLGIEPVTLGKKTSAVVNRPKEDFPAWST